MKTLSTPYQIMMLIASVLVSYYPTNFADICLVDDYGAISYFFSEETFSLKGIFFPHCVGGGYYRPLIMISYILDKQLWFLHERLMHFESVAAHILNVVLVFYICREAVYFHLKKRETYLPLVAALLFALHPIATESVNWISGRTDIMMGTFVLVSVLCLLRFIQCRSKILLAGSIFSALIACLAKESAFGFLIGLPLLAVYRAETASTVRYRFNILKVRLYVVYYIGAFLTALLVGSYWLVLGIALLYMAHLTYKRFEGKRNKVTAKSITTWFVFSMAAITVAVGLFVLMRKFVFTSNVSKIGQTVTLMLADLNYTISLFLGAVGFYVKKFFLPLPLNFFILEIDPLYDFLGIAILLLVCHLIISKKLPAIFTILGLLLFLPALPFAFGTIAWTAYAERYIYLSSAFWIVAICLWSENWLDNDLYLKRLVTSLIVVVCFVFAGITFMRSIVWQSNVTLMRNTVGQNPEIRKLRDMYIKALLDNEQISDALQQFSLAATELPSTPGDEQIALMIGMKLVGEHNYKEALQFYRNSIQYTSFNSEPLLSALIKHSDSSNISSMQLDRVSCEKNGSPVRNSENFNHR